MEHDEYYEVTYLEEIPVKKLENARKMRDCVKEVMKDEGGFVDADMPVINLKKLGARSKVID